MLNPKLVESSYSIALTETQSDKLAELDATNFITYMENRTQADKIGWVSSYNNEFQIIFVTLNSKNSIEQVIEFLEETLGTV